ncbi:MAG TPA: NAD-dependent epimerase/dehydratase family protein [Dermatophilaceae bacterium]|nr:NAD-dependent epimerase/dehydratase family protein [Dermatophilaceae bacterium]
MTDVVLVTGVSRYLGGRYAEELSRDTSITRILGVDVVPPPHPIGRAEFVRADIRNPMIGRIISQAKVDTVVHLNVLATPTAAGGRVSQKEINVIGTMQLLAACQKASTVAKLVVKSTAAVYGSSPRDPALFTEDTGPKAMPRSGFGKDSVEVEGYVRGFSRRRPEVEITTLRLANVIGPQIRTSLTDFFSLPVLPVPLGFDARMQLVHEDDAVAALLAATRRPGLGIVNVAGDGMLTVSQAAAMVGRPIVPVPFGVHYLGSLIRKAGLADFSSDQLSFLSYGRGLDTRRMRSELQFEPRYATREAFADFAKGVPPLIPGSDTAARLLGSAARGGASVLGEAAGLASGLVGAVGRLRTVVR